MYMEIYTDGAAKGNGQESAQAGWGWVAYDSKGKKVAYDYGKVIGEQTNNRGELTALIEAYKWVGRLRTQGYNEPIYLYSDSAYCVNGVNDWMHGWAMNGWTRSGGKAVVNLELWKTLYDLYHNTIFCGVRKVKGHNGILGNEEADLLAGQGVEGENDDARTTTAIPRTFS